MKKLFAVCLLALLLCSFTIPFFASAAPTEPSAAPTEATVEATEPKKDASGRPSKPAKNPFEAKNERAQSKDQSQAVIPTVPPKQETVEPTKYNGPAVIPPQPDPEIDYLPIILIGSGVVVIGISVAVLIVSRKKSK